MNRPTADALRTRVQTIHQRYDTYFAGQPRISRDAALLDEMLVQLDALAAELAALPKDERPELQSTVDANRALYRREAEAIRALQAGGPELHAAHDASQWAQLTAHRYRRHFAGRARGTRDLALLGEMIDDLARIERSLVEMQPRVDDEIVATTLATVRQNLELYRGERTAIATAREAGTLQEQADTLAALANDQFQLYRDHFAGQSRLSRRPALLERIIGQLEQLGDRMRALEAQGLYAESNEKNAQIVAERVGLYRQELGAVREARQQASLSALVDAFGEAANAVFARYREHFAGQDRGSRELDRLAALCDSLFDLARQMDDLDRVRADETNQHNLSVVLDHLRLYEKEYGLIQESRSGS